MNAVACCATTAFALVLLLSAAQADVTISTAATQNMSCAKGVCTPTASDAVLNVSDLQNLLASGSVKVKTAGSGVQADNIDVEDAVSWSNANTLALDAYQSITVDAGVSVTDTGGLTVTTDDGGSGGMLFFGTGGSVRFQNLSSQLAINGQSYTLESTLPALVSAVDANPAGNYALASNYDASNDGTDTTSPMDTTLTGTLEGLGNAISNLSIKHREIARQVNSVGLVTEVGRGGTIAGLRLTGLKMKTNGNQRQHNVGASGGVAGTNAGTLFNDSVEGNLSSRDSGLGALVGGNEGTVLYCSSSGTIRSPTAGGLAAGTSRSGTVSFSSSSATITATAPKRSQTQGAIGGGLVAVAQIGGTILESFATGSVTGGDDAEVGGLVGVADDPGEVANSYATGAVTGGANAIIGGFGGELSNQVFQDSYSTGKVAGGSGSSIGGFSGNDGGGTFTDAYWDTTTSKSDMGTGVGNEAGLTGLTSMQLKSGLPPGFDPATWTETKGVNKGFPYLIANPPQ